MGGFSYRALAIQPTGVRKMFDLAGDDVISFGLGEPDFQPPKVAIEAFHQAIPRALFYTRLLYIIIVPVLVLVFRTQYGGPSVFA